MPCDWRSTCATSVGETVRCSGANARATSSGSASASRRGYATLGQIGFEQRREYTAIGSVINLASRLCDEARPGQIVIGQRAFSAIEHCVESTPIGELSLKGFTTPIAAYEINGWRGAPRSS